MKGRGRRVRALLTRQDPLHSQRHMSTRRRSDARGQFGLMAVVKAEQAQPWTRARRPRVTRHDDAPEAAFAAARLEGCRACDGIVAAASNDAVLRTSVGDRPLLDARRRCDHDFAEKLRRRRDRCRAALIRATTAVDKNLAPRLRATRGETQATCTPFDDATDAEQAAADAVAATAALQTACGPGDAGFLATAAVRWASENCRALMSGRIGHEMRSTATEHITSLGGTRHASGGRAGSYARRGRGR